MASMVCPEMSSHKEVKESFKNSQGVLDSLTMKDVRVMKTLKHSFEKMLQMRRRLFYVKKQNLIFSI